MWQLSVGGFGHKDKLGFEKEFNEIVQEIQSGQGSGTPLETMVSGAGPRKLAGET